MERPNVKYRENVWHFTCKANTKNIAYLKEKVNHVQVGAGADHEILLWGVGAGSIDTGKNQIKFYFNKFNNYIKIKFLFFIYVAYSNKY